MSALQIKDTSLFLLIAFISGAGWIFVPSQVAVMPPMFSISYRFILSSCIILLIVFIRREKIFDRSILWLILFQGALMFPLNYYLTYSACKYSPSGLVGLISSFAIVPSYCLGIILKRHSFNLSTFLAIGVSIVGLIFLLRKSVVGYSHNSLGLLLAILSDLAVVAGLTIVPFLKKKTPLSILSITGQSMFIGGVLSFLIGVFQTQDVVFSSSKTYLLSLLILSGLTPLVFVSFYYFSNKKGAVFASYIWVIAPIFSVFMSYLVKEYRPELWDGLGIFLIISSCLYVNRTLATNTLQEGP